MSRISHINPQSQCSGQSQGHGPGGKRNVLISFLTYDQDDYEYRKRDESFMKSFLPPNAGEQDWREVLDRNKIWRPSVALAQLQGLDKNYPDLIFDDYYLLWDEKEIHQKIKDEVQQDIDKVMRSGLHIENPGITKAGDTKDVYRNLFRYLSEEKFHAPDACYYVNCANGTTAIRNCLFLFTQTGQITALRITPMPWANHKQRNTKKDGKGEYSQECLRTAKGCYTIEDPKEFSEAYAAIDVEEHDTTLKTLTRGVVTKDPTLLEKIANVVNKIKEIPKSNLDFRTKQTILITGETGVGKTQLARNIARALGLVDSDNRAKFVHLNCAHICGADPNIPRIELFGATGKIGDTCPTEGALAKADKGMLFLDEIGELPLDLQSMLLTALDNGEYIPLGGDATKPQKSSFQLVCGTNQPLEKLVAKGKFRLDLLNRINAWHFELSPLRNRPDDIELNIKQMTAEIGIKCGKKGVAFTPDAESELINFAKSPEITWEGNFRELNALIAHMVVLSDGLSITKKIVAEELEEIRARYRKAAELKATIRREIEEDRIRYIVLQNGSPIVGMPPGGQLVEGDTSLLNPQPANPPQPSPGEKETSLRHALKTGITQKTYDSLPQLARFEYDLLCKAVYQDHIVQKDALCHAVYGDAIKPKSLFNHLKSKPLYLNLSHGSLSYKGPNL